MRLLPLERVEHEPSYGGKAVQLGAALRAGLPVPDGIGLDVELVAAVAAGDAGAREACCDAFAQLDTAAAVRSSAVGEDGAMASFAGQYLTRLHVTAADALVDAVVQVWASARSDAALAYRRWLGLDGAPAIAVVLQRMVLADCAGVLFTRDPISGADERVIEAAWGLGEAVVAGLVAPDRYRMRRGGAVIERHAGDKDIAVRAVAGGGTAEQPVPVDLRRAPCLDDRRLEALEELATGVEAAFPGGHDIEWAFFGEQLYLLQRRAITR